MSLQEIWTSITTNPLILKTIYIVGVLVFAYLIRIILKKVLLGGMRRLIKRTKTHFDDFVLAESVLKHLPGIIPMLILYYFSYLLPDIQQILQRVITVIIVFMITLALSALLSALNDYYNHLKLSRGKPIKGYVEIIKILVYIFSIVIMIGILTGESPWVLLSGVGALTAVLILVFRDTILSFIASLQISSYDLVRVGDWIEVPKYSADGNVIDIALHTVKVQNWDKTITIIPTHKLIEDTFKNWRGMKQTGGRRIKRAINIDQNSVRFVNEEMLKRFMKIQLLKQYIQSKKEELEKHNTDTKADLIASIVNGRRMTNIGTFRVYLDAYLAQHPRIHAKLTRMVRQMPPGPTGLPIEIYAFTNTTDWLTYEGIQSDIFDHILAILPEFGLRLFQNPIGSDFRGLMTDEVQ